MKGDTGYSACEVDETRRRWPLVIMSRRGGRGESRGRGKTRASCDVVESAGWGRRHAHGINYKLFEFPIEGNGGIRVGEGLPPNHFQNSSVLSRAGLTVREIGAMS